MLFVAEFADVDLNPVLVEAEDSAAAVAAVARAGVESPVSLLREVPPGLFLAEIWYSGGGDDNPANWAQSGVALEPFDDCADWLDTLDAADLAPADRETSRELDAG